MIDLKQRFATIPFRPMAMLNQGGLARTFVLGWLFSCVIIVASSLLTRYLEWTGLELSFAGMSIFITIYIPMLFCIPMVYWFGYYWAAIPAYFSTFMVAYVGGMPLGWIAIFSFANPLSLAFYYLSLAILPKHRRINNLVLVISFVLVSLMASLAGSTGAYIWAFANKAGITNALQVWQGWWLGGWIQAVFIVLPIISFLGPSVIKRCNTLVFQPSIKLDISYRAISMATIAFTLVLAGYVITARYIGILQLNRLKNASMAQSEINIIDNAINGMSAPLFILLIVMVATMFLIFRAVIFWREELKNVNKLLTEKNIELERLASTDELTGLLVRRYIMDIANLEFARARRNSQALSLLMIDIDNFKRINDVHGHLVGDSVIREVANRIQHTIRPYDSAGRYGGEEFIVVLPNAEPKDARLIALRILEIIANAAVDTDKGKLPVTISVGVASLQSKNQNLQALIEDADQALLTAKEKGKNCIQVFN